MRNRHRPNNPCPKCTGSIFERGTSEPADDGSCKPVWRCANCYTEVPRRKVVRRTNKRIALDKLKELHAAWERVDEELNELVEAGIPNGCLIVHSSTFNHHMDRLLRKPGLTRFDLKYHTREALVDLEKAKAFIAEKKSLLPARKAE